MDWFRSISKARRDTKMAHLAKKWNMRTIFNFQFTIFNLQSSSAVAFGLLLLMGFSIAATAQDAPPRSLDPRLKVEQFAEHPQVVTPTGIDVDHKGKVWAIESNTHFPPEGYKGHPSDRVLVMSDAD